MSNAASYVCEPPRTTNGDRLAPNLVGCAVGAWTPDGALLPTEVRLSFVIQGQHRPVCVPLDNAGVDNLVLALRKAQWQVFGTTARVTPEPTPAMRIIEGS